jgi:hypothetical protein
MTYILSQPGTFHQQTFPKQKKSLIANFIQWATNEDDEHHIAWVGASITAMAAVFFPLTMSAILLNGANFGLIITAMISLSLVVITNLASLSTRYTIPFFLLGILIDAGAIIASFLIK